MSSEVTRPDEVALRAKLAELSQEHRDLDNAIAALTDAGARDQLQLTRLKKRKLQLKDEIAKINDRLLPDIIALGRTEYLSCPRRRASRSPRTVRGGSGFPLSRE